MYLNEQYGEDIVMLWIDAHGVATQTRGTCSIIVLDLRFQRGERLREPGHLSGAFDHLERCTL